MQSTKVIEIVSRSGENGIFVSCYFGVDIREVATKMVELAKAERAPVHCEINGINLRADYGTPADAVVQSYRDEIARRSAAWRESSAGKAALAESARREAASVAALRELLAELPEHMGCESRLVAWVGRLALLDRADFDTQTVADQLESVGYVRNDHVGDRIPNPSKSQLARWIIGQAIDALRQNHAIRSVFSMHAEKYAAAND